MPYALTVDQRASRDAPDEVDATIELLRTTPDLAVVLPFARTVGDEFQGLLDDPVSVLAAILTLMRTQAWHVGLGIGPIDRPLPEDGDPRRARGAAFFAARDAVDEAKADPHHLAVSAPGAPDEAYDVKAVLDLLDTVRQARTAAGWEVVDLAAGRPPAPRAAGPRAPRGGGRRPRGQASGRPPPRRNASESAARPCSSGSGQPAGR